MTEKRESRKIVAAVIGLGQSLGLTTVAEGIESQEQAEMLLWLGCELGQGYFYGQAVPAEELGGSVIFPREKMLTNSLSAWKRISNLDVSPSQRLAQLQAVYDGAPVGLAFVDQNLRYVNLNKKLADMNGAPVERHLGSEVSEMIPELFPVVEPYIKRALAGEAIAEVEAKFPITGETRLVSYQPAIDEGGEVVGVSIAVADITERKRAEDALRDSESHYRRMVELNPQVLWIMDPQGRNLDVSPRWDTIPGLMKTQSADQKWLTDVHPDDMRAVVKAIAASRRTVSPIDVRYRVADGASGWVWKRSRGAPRFDLNGNIACWYGTVQDVEGPGEVLERIEASSEEGIPIERSPSMISRHAARLAKSSLRLLRKVLSSWFYAGVLVSALLIAFLSCITFQRTHKSPEASDQVVHTQVVQDRALPLLDAVSTASSGRPEVTGTQNRLIGQTLQSPPLTQVSQVRELTVEQAGRHVPVRLHGVITAFSGWRDYFFFQDASGGIAINREEHGKLQAGDVVDLEGVSDPGLFANSVISQRVQLRGRSRMPLVSHSTYSDLDGGKKDAEWVSVRGTVRSATVEPIWGKSVLVLQTDIGGRMISVRIFRFSVVDAARLVDAVVEVHGVCGTVYNDKRQFTGVRLFVDDLQTVRVEEPAPWPPYDIPTIPIRNVMQFQPRRSRDHRVKVAGTVTYQGDDGHSLYMQDGADGILLSTTEQQVAPVGARVEALGFPELNGYSPTLKSAVFRIIGSTQGSAAHVGLALPEPVMIRAAEFMERKDTFVYAPHDEQLVRLQATVISSLAIPNEEAWLMRDGQADFVTSLPTKANGPPMRKIAIGSVLLVTGVMAVATDSNGQPLSFQILLRSADDLVVLSQASWWTPLHLAMALGVLLAITLGAILWTVVLRRQVLRQTRRLRDSERRFRKLSQRDTLTGLANRSHLHEQLESALRRAQQTGSLMGLVMLDLDHFKEVNDNLGHHTGDELLRIVAHRIRTSVRRGDIVARMGGDEFVVVLTVIGDESEAEMIGAQLVSSLTAPAEIGSIKMAISASVGICTYPMGGTSEQTLLQHVDEAMYRAKARGRNSFCVYREAGFREGGSATPNNSLSGPDGFGTERLSC